MDKYLSLSACFRPWSHRKSYENKKSFGFLLSPIWRACTTCFIIFPVCFWISIIHTWLGECTELFLLRHCTVGKIPNFGSFISIQCCIRYMQTVLASVFRFPYILQLFNWAHLVCPYLKRNSRMTVIHTTQTQLDFVCSFNLFFCIRHHF